MAKTKQQIIQNLRESSISSEFKTYVEVVYRDRPLSEMQQEALKRAFFSGAFVFSLMMIAATEAMEEDEAAAFIGRLADEADNFVSDRAAHDLRASEEAKFNA